MPVHGLLIPVIVDGGATAEALQEPGIPNRHDRQVCSFQEVFVVRNQCAVGATAAQVGRRRRGRLLALLLLR